jgi:hypothetical protein
MGKAKKTIPTVNDLEWNDYVLGLLNDDEKIEGNPTTDGLRRIFEIALDCTLVGSNSEVVQSPDPNNGQRATVVHSLTFILNDPDLSPEFKTRSVNGSADVYWGNCDKIYRNHPVAVAETRAEGRALRRGLRLRKVVAAEEIAKDVEDIDGDSVGKITSNQINFIDVLAKRLNINVKNLVTNLNIDTANVLDLAHDEAVLIIRKLSSLQQNIEDIPETIMSYDSNWRD